MRKKSNLISTYCFALVAAFTLAFCSNDDFGPYGRPVYTFALDNNEHAFFREYAANDSLEIEVSVTEDSRCPVGTICVWEGYVKVTFGFNDKLDPVDLYKYEGGHQNPNHPNSYSFNFDGLGYELTLSNVTPYPTTENQDVKKSVEFTLTQN